MLYLDSDDVAPVDIQPRFHLGEKNSKPVADCLHIIWSRRKQISGTLRLKKDTRLVNDIPVSAERSMMFGF